MPTPFGRRPVLPTVPMEARSLTRIRRIRSGNTLASRALTTSFPARIRSRQTSPLNHAKLLLQPRVGLAWDPTGTGTWAVRAAFGIHNDLIDNLGIRAQAGMPPYAARESLPVSPAT